MLGEANHLERRGEGLRPLLTLAHTLRLRPAGASLLQGISLITETRTETDRRVCGARYEGKP